MVTKEYAKEIANARISSRFKQVLVLVAIIIAGLLLSILI
jgi:hypothetical protein